MSGQLKTSFIDCVDGLVLPVALLLCLCTVFAFGLSIYLAYDAYITNSSLSERESYLSELQVQYANVSGQNKELTLPTNEMVLELNAAIERINGVGAVKGADISALLSELERLLPKSVYIRKLDHNRKEGVLLLLAEAGAVDHLTSFLKKLESSSFFTSVLLTRQSQDKSNGMYQYELRLVEDST